jgi:hypothetical protein
MRRGCGTVPAMKLWRQPCLPSNDATIGGRNTLRALLFLSWSCVMRYRFWVVSAGSRLMPASDHSLQKQIDAPHSCKKGGREGRGSSVGGMRGRSCCIGRTIAGCRRGSRRNRWLWQQRRAAERCNPAQKSNKKIKWTSRKLKQQQQQQQQ